MAYTKVGWQDLPSTQTPINTTNLDHMDDGIAAALTSDNIKNSRNANTTDTYSCDYLNNKTDKNLIDVYINNNVTINQEWTELPFDRYAIFGDKLELRNNKVYVKAGVSAVKVSAIAFMENMGADHIGYVWMHIQKNGALESGSITSGSSGFYESITCPDKIIWVNEGDSIGIRLNNSNWSVGNYPTARGGIENTRLHVEVIE